MGPIETLRFKRATEADPALAAEVERHRKLRASIAGHFAPVAGEPTPERLTALLGQSDNVVAFRPSQKKWFGQGGRYAALAASLVAGLVAGQLLPLGSSSPIGFKGDAVVAQGDLAVALDTQLAAAQPDGAYRVGVSFRSGDKRYCRTFTGDAGAGIGCRGDDGWMLERFVAGSPTSVTGAYRQAGSASADILAAAQEMMAGEPLDAAAERAAQKRGWR
ncbi:anti-sigma factor [Sphingomonas sp. SRS2]|nr:anti-sigma factor [Sphingomonas sp. SRS2]